MRRKQFLLGVMVLLVSLLVAGCGIPKEVYDTVLAERNAAQSKVESLQTRANSLQDELDKAQEQIESIEKNRSELESDLATVQSQLSSLWSDLNDTESDLAAAQARIAEAEAQIARMEEVYKVVLFFEDFEDGDAEGWNLVGDWAVIQEDGNYVLKGIGSCSTDVGPQEWADYTLWARIKFHQSANVNFRFTTGVGMYFINMVPDGPTLNKKILNTILFVKSAESLKENQWIDLKLEIKRDQIGVYTDGVWLFQYRDNQPLLSGTIGFEAPENSVVYVDDVIVMVAR